MDLVGTIGQTEDTSPGEEMGQRSRARETHGTMSLRDRRERGMVKLLVLTILQKPSDTPASLYPRPSEQLVGPPLLSWLSPSSPPVL